ncbi:hypothetical protein [uncultured Tenacibaculum sp.]|uniref:hypothetical protein n=1 Tax=uncultured Tenacibaculum sp. TaxID=174713 RepID=UPI00261E4911|nr:hypothetical protein [uncultured Tenacibaculum sp.]
MFESAKDSLLNHPFVNVKVNQGMIDDIIEFEIKQVLGGKIRNVITKTESLNHIFNSDILQQKIFFYQKLVIETFIAWTKSYIH